MKHLTKDRYVYELGPKVIPAITIDSGDELLCETHDAFEGLRDIVAISQGGPQAPVTGPINVEGAVPGDIRISRTLRSVSPVKMMLSRKVLEQIG